MKFASRTIAWSSTRSIRSSGSVVFAAAKLPPGVGRSFARRLVCRARHQFESGQRPRCRSVSGQTHGEVRLKGIVGREGHCHVDGVVSFQDGKEEVAVSRSSVSRSGDQPGGALVLPISAQPARHRGATVRARRGRELRDDPALVRQVWCELRASRQGRTPGSTWHLDEMFVTLRGEPYLLWRAVDQHGAELDILLQKRRDKAAAKRFFKPVSRPARRFPARSSPTDCAAIQPRKPSSRSLRTCDTCS